MNSKPNVTLATAFFFMVSILDLIGIFADNEWLKTTFKPLILLSLIALYLFVSLKKNKWYLLALICSFGGDVFLLFDAQSYFMLGLGSFLLAHLFYITLVSKQLKKPNNKEWLLSFVIFFGFLIGLLMVLKGHLGAFKIPVVVYGLVISSFGALCFINNLQQKDKASAVLLIGALLFMLSDSLLAVNKFYRSIEILNLLVMLTYIAAQYLIFRAVVLAEKT
ncbi:MAG: lysoplasmalogenase [Flavobacteriales bacterium CG03_land_8_20_14_0_80_35_15]|nr:MAG: lysoplasmalogenase [Flavobacteriales bacterium CG03_land_8_20_14_0_80_35_15]